MDRIDGRVALVTGGGSGIGRGSALALAREGAKVVVADIDGATADAVAAEIITHGGEAVGVPADVTDDASFAALRDLMLDRYGRVDIIMNNAASITRGLPEHLPLAEWQRILDVNLLSIVRSNSVFLPLLIEQGEGHIVNTASFAGLFTYAYDRQPYAATKAAIIQISEGLYLYLKPKGIGVTCLCPGPVRTNIMAGMRSFGPDTETRGPPGGFVLKEAEDVGAMVVDAIRTDRFMLPTDDKVLPFLAERARDWDGFLSRMAARLG